MHTEIEFVTFATSGNASNFGDLIIKTGYFNVGASNGREVVYGGGDIGSPFVTLNQSNFITIASTGNATDFGDLNTATRYGHGGLSKFNSWMFCWW